MSQINRRKFLGAGVGITSLLGIGPLAKAAGVCLGLTPKQTEGPFYPIKDQADKDWDLVQVMGHNKAALGEIIFVKGTVTDKNCKPVVGALVEIWQACHTGKYNHPNDTNSASLDPDFQYWGRAVTNAEGNYIFRTILPGAYPADTDWVRPPHIHFKVHKLGFHELTTQLYFSGQSLNDQDKILQNLSRKDQNAVVRPILVDAEKNKVVTFDVGILAV